MVNQSQYAVTAWRYAVALVLRGLPDGPEREVLLAADQHPSVENIRAVIGIGRCKPWLALIESALVECGIAALETMIKENDRA
jgi:hypothetical protein